ncbi:Lysine--tRNA ligase [Colletotrichum orbiculare MAFF 240422]|uniref:Lysyl-tRNA synthetase n=1 Tax=Colletotrichum orbiculare (strain 104-T / ATCC 96160 / CBS 514.97 / LARS 414 / MAFF 240422) TaxID=1213857 RepID=N4V1C4_COLOR|nr:Lysine--tRNA ligase [Colletotrichum orbiculare MAFF 240422]
MENQPQQKKKKKKQDSVEDVAGKQNKLAGPESIWGKVALASLSPSKYKKARSKRFEQAAQNDLFKETHPRLVHRTKHMSVPEFNKKWRKEQLQNLEDPSESEVVTLYGRVKSARSHGLIMFISIVNEFEHIQGEFNYKNLAASDPMLRKETFKLFGRMVERGDHISITGKPHRDKRGFVAINAIMLPELLSPALEPIPESLTDPETRSQKRHVDMIVNPEVADTLRLRAHITKYMRDFFHDRRFLEFQTPILAENAGGAVARAFTTSATEFPSRELALRVAPELWLKRLVVGGVHNVFEIGPAFRNEGIDGTHNPEFTMCEFYSAYATLPELIARTEDLLSGLALHCRNVIASDLASLPRPDVAKLVNRPYRQLEFIPTLEEALGFRLPKLTGKDAYTELVAILTLSGVKIPGGVPPTMAKLLDRLAGIYIEPKSFEGPLFVTHHPACMSPLAKSFLCPKTYQLVSARTELFVNGRELANMYEEENDPYAQAQKLAEHKLLGTNADKTADPDAEDAPLDKSYIRAIEAGLPPTGGWGCGVERLVMLFSGANRISDCLSFGTLRNVVGLSSEAKKTES